MTVLRLIKGTLLLCWKKTNVSSLLAMAAHSRTKKSKVQQHQTTSTHRPQARTVNRERRPHICPIKKWFIRVNCYKLQQGASLISLSHVLLGSSHSFYSRCKLFPTTNVGVSLRKTLLILQTVNMILEGIICDGFFHVAPPCFYGSPEGQTKHWCQKWRFAFFKFLAANVGRRGRWDEDEDFSGCDL